MKKYIFSLMLSTAFCATCPSIAMETEEQREQGNRLMREALQRIDAASWTTQEIKGRAQEARRTKETCAENLEIKARKAGQKCARLEKLPVILERLIYEAETSEEAKKILKLAVQASEAREPIEKAVQHYSIEQYYLEEYLKSKGNLIDPSDEDGMQQWMQLSESASKAHVNLISIKKKAKDAEATWIAAANDLFFSKREK